MHSSRGIQPENEAFLVGSQDFAGSDMFTSLFLACFDDVMGLIIGPLFAVAEALFLLGLRPDLKDALSADG